MKNGYEFFIGFKERPGKPDHNIPSYIHRDYGCFYEIRKEGDSCAWKCAIHPYNPLICYTFPLVVNLTRGILVNQLHLCNGASNVIKEAFKKEIKLRKEISELIQNYKDYESEM